MITSEEPGIEPSTLYSQFVTLLYRWTFRNYLLLETTSKNIKDMNIIINITFYMKYQLKTYIYIYIQGVTGGMCETSGECSLGQTIPI